jgi:hypothetical protein
MDQIVVLLSTSHIIVDNNTKNKKGIQCSLTILAYEITPDDGRLRPKPVVKKEKKKGEYTYKVVRLHCDGNSVIIICKIMQQVA